MNPAAFAELANEIIKMSGLLGSDKSFIEGLTPKQVHILMEIGSKTFRHGDLAGILGVDPSTLTRTLDPLVRANLIDRQTNPENRREVLIRLSGHGLEVLEEVRNKMSRLLAQILEQIPEGQQQQVESGIGILLTAIKNFNMAR
ncbi:MarR family winged helix-turn-helix transcriptional regulator [Paenibacillus thermotolerans]|uniref:MarR family winged helix-turn-helix transcriptional regulator n=1 Tax=Paenibacillus thermotolerans TaxID=3027807 RepID=UPI002368EECD|nr:MULTISPECIES: MarR family transcriptional regulator [unclassified Paenibacillus]